MTKRDIVVRVAGELGDEHSHEPCKPIKQDTVLQVVQKTLDVILAALARGETVELRNFGVFEIKVRKARVGRNPNVPDDDVPIPARTVVKFKPGKEMREQVLKLTPDRRANA